MQKQLFFILSFFFIAWSSSAQVKKSDIIFEKTTIDFGRIFVEAGIVLANYEFTNNSTQDFVIKSLDAACGCTNPRSSADTIAPGASGNISVEFNPKGMRGKVAKYVNVIGNYSDDYQVELKFTTEIVSSEERDPNAYYKGEFGYLLLDKIRLDWGDRYVGQTFLDSVLLSNDGYNDIIISGFTQSPAYITTLNTPITLKVGETKALLLKVDVLDTVGKNTDVLKLKTNDKFFPTKQITVGINYKQDYSLWKKRNYKKAPQIVFSNEKIQMGEVKSGAITRRNIDITNSGKTNLAIRRIDTDCSCAIIAPSKLVIAPGESIKVDVKFDSLYKKGSQSKAITVYSNDPINPVKKIYVQAVVY